MSDPLDELRDLAPPVDARPELLEQLRNDLMTIIERDAHSKTEQLDELQPRRAKRKWAIPIAAALVACTGAAAYALSLSSSDSTSVECPTGIYDAVTGDPVVDCSNEWRRSYNSEPPAMVAYDNGSGGVTVLLADDPVPEGYTPVGPGQFQNSSIIEFEASLDDYGTGLSSGCYDEPAAREIIQADLDRLGLAAWTITADSSRLPDGADLCAVAIVVPDAQQVQVIGLSNDAVGTDPYARFAANLNDQLEAECVGIDEAATVTRTLGDSTDIRINGAIIEVTEEAGVLVINTVEDPAATCTQADVNVGGRVEVILRGPKS